VIWRRAGLTSSAELLVRKLTTEAFVVVRIGRTDALTVVTDTVRNHARAVLEARSVEAPSGD